MPVVGVHEGEDASFRSGAILHSTLENSSGESAGQSPLPTSRMEHAFWHPFTSTDRQTWRSSSGPDARRPCGKRSQPASLFLDEGV
jgi:hypothetical protein